MFDKKFFEGEIKNSSFLITGGAGFIGSNIAEYLLKYGAEKVRVLDNLSTGFFENIESFIPFSNFEFINGDIRNLEDCKKACDGIDFVLHQAALGSVPRSIENPIATNGSNIDGFLNMLVAAKDSTVKRFVYASSSSVYGDSPILPKSEDEIGAPLSPYAVTKYVNELYAAVFFKTYRLEVIGLRYFNIFGPRQNPKGAYAAAIPLFMDAILSNKSPYINGDGEQSRDFTFVENAVQANIKSIFTKDTMAIGEVFNIACGDRITINELFQMLKDYSGSSVSAEYREPRAGDIKDSLADISKAKKMLEYSPEFGVKEGLQITLDWFKSKFFFVAENKLLIKGKSNKTSFIKNIELKNNELLLGIEIKKVPPGIARLFYITLNSTNFNRNTLFYACKNGSNKIEKFSLKNSKSFNHGARVSDIVSATTCLGATDGIFYIGDSKKMLKIFIDKKINPILPMVEFFKYKKNYLLRVYFSSRETDDTSKQKINDIAAKIKIRTLATTLF